MSMSDKAIAIADELGAKNLLKIISDATTVYDDGLQAVSLAGERCTIYVGWCIRFTHPRLGARVAMLNGVNPRVWGTQRGRAEIGQGEPNMSEWDPCPAVMYPAGAEISSILVTNNWKPRTTSLDDEIRMAIAAKKAGF